MWETRSQDEINSMSKEELRSLHLLRTDEILVTLKFYHEPGTIKLHVYSSDTVKQFIAEILKAVEPLETRHTSRTGVFEIGVGDEILFENRNLREVDGSLTLRSLGMEGWAEIFVVPPGGPFLRGRRPYKSAYLEHLAEESRAAIDRGTSAVEFRKVFFDKKIVFVEIPISEGMNLSISIMIKGTDRVCDVKETIAETIVGTCNGFNWREYCRDVGAFVLLSGTRILDENLPLSYYSIKEHDKLKLQWITIGRVDVSVAHEINGRGCSNTVKVESLDTVGKLKLRIYELIGIPPEKQLLRYQNLLVSDDSRSLTDFGIGFYWGEVFRWCPQAHIGTLELFPRIEHPIMITTVDLLTLFPRVPSYFAYEDGACNIGGVPSCPVGNYHLHMLEETTSNEVFPGYRGFHAFKIFPRQFTKYLPHTVFPWLQMIFAFEDGGMFAASIGESSEGESSAMLQEWEEVPSRLAMNQVSEEAPSRKKRRF